MPRTFVHSAESGSCGGGGEFLHLRPHARDLHCCMPKPRENPETNQAITIRCGRGVSFGQAGAFGFALSHHRRSGRIQVYFSLLREKIRILHTPRWFGFGNPLCANCIQVTNSLEVERLMEQLKAGLLTPSGSGFCRWRQLGHPWKELMTGAMYYLIVRRSDCRTDHPM